MLRTFADVEELLNPVLAQARKAGLECDGMTNVFHAVLTQHQVAHVVYCGEMVAGARCIRPHFWIELATADRPLARLDGAAHLWLGPSAAIPDGLVDPSDYPNVLYLGQAVELEVLPQVFVDVLLTPLPCVWTDL